MRIKERFNKKLLVEGNDDQHVVWALCEKFQVDEIFDVVDCEGIENLLMTEIPLRLRGSEAKALGILVDADVKIEDRWRSIQKCLSDAGFSVATLQPDNRKQSIM